MIQLDPATSWWLIFVIALAASWAAVTLTPLVVNARRGKLTTRRARNIRLGVEYALEDAEWKHDVRVLAPSVRLSLAATGGNPLARRAYLKCLMRRLGAARGLPW